MKADYFAGVAQLARASAFQAEGRGFESRFPLHSFRWIVHQIRPCSSAVEHLLGKEEVTSSSLVMGSISLLQSQTKSTRVVWLVEVNRHGQGKV